MTARPPRPPLVVEGRPACDPYGREAAPGWGGQSARRGGRRAGWPLRKPSGRSRRPAGRRRLQEGGCCRGVAIRDRVAGDEHPPRARGGMDGDHRAAARTRRGRKGEVKRALCQVRDQGLLPSKVPGLAATDADRGGHLPWAVPDAAPCRHQSAGSSASYLLVIDRWNAHGPQPWVRALEVPDRRQMPPAETRKGMS